MSIIVPTIAPSSARDYLWLADAIGTYSGNRTDLADKVADFVILAEQRLRADIEARGEESTASPAVTAGDPTVTLPEDFVQALSVALTGERPLDYLTPAQFDAMYANASGGTPRHYTTLGAYLILGPTPATTTTLALKYRAGLPALADAGGSNWLIRKNANAYLAACMVEGAIPYTKNWNDLPYWEKKYADAIASVNKLNWGSAADMRVRSDVRAV
jgi:hypothetical protein